MQDGLTGQNLSERYSHGLRRIDFAKMQRWDRAGFVAPGSLTPASRLQDIAAGSELVSEWMTEITR
jgi:hypothetical protein